MSDASESKQVRSASKRRVVALSLQNDTGDDTDSSTGTATSKRKKTVGRGSNAGSASPAPSREEQVREQRKLRNKQAAQASRDRQKNYIKQLEARVLELESQLEVAQAAGWLSGASTGSTHSSGEPSVPDADADADEGVEMEREGSSSASSSALSEMDAGPLLSSERDPRLPPPHHYHQAMDEDDRGNKFTVLDTAKGTMARVATLF